MKKLILIFFLIQFLFSCSARKSIPEITPYISADRMRDVSLSPDIFSILSAEGSITLIDSKGNISKFSEENKNMNVLASYKTGFRNKLFFKENLLVLFPVKKGESIFYDLDKKKTIYRSKRDLNIIDVGKSHYLHSQGKKFEIIDFVNEKILFSKIIDQGKLIGSDLSEDLVVLLFEKSILTYNIKNNSEKVKPIEVKPVSPFLRLRDNIYFGDESRSLIKFSLKKMKMNWKYRFQKLLRIEPISYKGLIIASPGDNNTYLITQKGGVKDWYRSESGRLFDPVLMKNHLAVILRTEDGTSINYYGLKDHSISKFKDKFLKLKFPPVYLKNSLYSAGTEGDDPQLKLIKIGNIFGSSIKLIPEKGYETGKSIKFLIKTLNMYKPEIKTVLYNEKEEIVFSRLTPFNNNPSFVWVPESGGSFTLKVTTKEKDGIEITDFKKVIVTDTELMYINLQKKLHQKCDSALKSPDKKNEKKDQ